MHTLNTIFIWSPANHGKILSLPWLARNLNERHGIFLIEFPATFFLVWLHMSHSNSVILHWIGLHSDIWLPAKEDKIAALPLHAHNLNVSLWRGEEATQQAQEFQEGILVINANYESR